MKSKILLMCFLIIAIFMLIAGIAVSVGMNNEQSETGKFIQTAETQSGIYGATVTKVTPSSDNLLGKYEKKEQQFKRYDFEDVIVYFHQRMIDDTIVEGDYIAYQFDRETEELLHKKVHWRSNLPEHITHVITKEQAEFMVRGDVQFTKLCIISADSVVFPLKPTPENPCWIVRSVDNGDVVVTIIDAIDGKMLGYGVPPPTGFSFAFSGPNSIVNCRGTYAAWYRNAALWFNTMGYPADVVTYPDEVKVKGHIQSNETVMFYEVAHGNSRLFTNECVDTTSAYEIHNWIASYAKMPFTFIGSCGGMCDLAPFSLSYEFRKGSMINTTTVGYCGMATEDCYQAWTNSVNWQDALFNYMNQGDTVKEAFDKAIEDYPMCVGCMRFAGDEKFAVVPAVDRVPLLTDVYEPDDNYNQATWIVTDGTKQYHDFYVPGDQDWLRFNATGNMSYKIETSYLGNDSDTFIYLYDKDGITEITHDDDGGEGLASKIIWSCITPGTYYINARHYSPSSNGPDTYYHLSVLRCPPITFNDVYADYGNDTDGDGLYDYLMIDVGVNVSNEGSYGVEGCLYDKMGNCIEKSYNYTYLDTGNQIVKLKFYGIKIRRNGINGPFYLKHLYLSNATDYTQLHYIYNTAYTSSNYNYTDFQILPAYFCDVYYDYGEDTDSDGLYNYLVINVDIDMNEAGYFQVYGILCETGTYNSIDFGSNITYLNEGTQTVQLRFEGILIRNNEYNGTYDLLSLSLHDLNGSEILDYRFYAYTTSYYNYTKFQIPPAEFNDVYSDYGEDNDGDGFYNYLVIDVGVDVREAGYYYVSGDINEHGTHKSIDYDYYMKYLDEGTQTVQLRFEGILIRDNEYNGTYDLNYLWLSNPLTEQIDHRNYAYTTSYYEYTEFESPQIVKVFHAGSLAVPLELVEQQFEALHPEVDVQRESMGSVACIQQITEFGKNGNVLASADYSLIPDMMYPDYADWYVRFACNDLVLAYNPELSMYADEITPENWYDILRRDGVIFGFSNPNDDPCGYQSVMVFQLAELEYGDDQIFADLILENTAITITEEADGTFHIMTPEDLQPNTEKVDIRPKSVELVAFVEEGGLDYAFEYRSVAVQHNLAFVDLPPGVDLSSVDRANTYKKVQIELVSGDVLMGKPNVYGITVPSVADNPEWGLEFVKFVIGEPGQQIFEDNGQSPIVPPVGSGEIPAELRNMVLYEVDTFDTGEPSNPYPSIAGTHDGTITLPYNLSVSKLYTYPCPGTGGHTEYVKIRKGSEVIAERTWNGYTGDWHNLTFNNSFTLYANETYNYTIRTGSYPQIHHTDVLNIPNGAGYSEPVHFNTLIEYLPEAPSGWDGEDPFGQTFTTGEGTWSMAMESYTKADNEELTADVGIMDSAYQQVGWMAAWQGFYSYESTDGYAKTVTVEGYPAWEAYTKDDNQYVLYVNINDRFMVFINTNSDRDTLYDFADAIDFYGIADLGGRIGIITCTEFVDINGKRHEGWIPAHEPYNYTIVTGSYPQIHHTNLLNIPDGAGGGVSVTRDLPDEPVYPGTQITVTLNQSGFIFDAGIVTEVLPPGFMYLPGSLPSDRVGYYDPETNELQIQFKGDKTMLYKVRSGTTDQIEAAAFSGSWKTFDQMLNELSGEVEGDTRLAVAVGVITCTEFVDVNGKRHEGWIPAIRLF